MCAGKTREMYGWRWWAGICDGVVLAGLRLQRVIIVTGSGNWTETLGQSRSAELRRVVWVPNIIPDQ